MENKIIETQIQHLGLISSTNNSAVGPSGILFGPSYQQASTNKQHTLANKQQTITNNTQGLTNNTQGLTINHPNQIPANINQNYIPILSEQGQRAKADLEVIVATGKAKEFTGKQITLTTCLKKSY
jgi:hypothetical protein